MRIARKKTRRARSLYAAVCLSGIPRMDLVTRLHCGCGATSPVRERATRKPAAASPTPPPGRPKRLRGGSERTEEAASRGASREAREEGSGTAAEARAERLRPARSAAPSATLLRRRGDRAPRKNAAAGEAHASSAIARKGGVAGREERERDRKKNWRPRGGETRLLGEVVRI